jgi:hypothetical protein
MIGLCIVGLVYKVLVVYDVKGQEHTCIMEVRVTVPRGGERCA